MASRINLLKIITAVSFLLVLVSGEKMSFFIGFYLLLAIFNPYEIGGSFYAFIVSGFALYLFISGNVKKKNLTDDIICVTGIIGMYFFVYKAIDIRYISISGILTTSIFLLFSFTTFGLIIYRHMVKYF